MSPIFREDPYPSYNFEVIVNGVSNDGRAVRGSFAEASGLEVAMDPIEYRNGSEDATPRKILGQKKFTNISLKRGMTGDAGFWSWVASAMNGQVVRAEGAIIMLDENRNEVMRWNFRRGWPCKHTGPEFNAANNEIAMETLEICHEGLEIDV